MSKGDSHVMYHGGAFAVSLECCMFLSVLHCSETAQSTGNFWTTLWRSCVGLGPVETPEE